MGAQKIWQMNRLASETSPYLLQHADNPVHWQPWDEPALAAAREQDRPILLSIGYSACHWCHVMAHESFEDDATAEVMNELFINIKVDREERPDLDHVYQTAHRVLAQRPGGWPLTVFLTPDEHTPFFAGTYFPREPRFGMPGFKDVLQRIHAAWMQQREQLLKQNQELRRAFQALQQAPAPADMTLDDTLILQARRQLETDFDSEYGGFGSAPKFPRPSAVEFLLRHGRDHRDPPAARMACFTLAQMASSGIYDQLGGGFFRYSVDKRWEIPHFEKMLYDNGLLLSLYSDAWQYEQDPILARAVRETASWLQRDMQADTGGYFSSLDADADGREGGYYAWSDAQLEAALPDSDERELVRRHYGLDGDPNFEGEWQLNVRRPLARLAEEGGSSRDELEAALHAARTRLLQARAQRTPPGRDEKVLTSWNALAIAGMARAGRVFDERQWIDSAERALDFIRAQLWQDGRLLACHKDGRSRFPAYLDDHAYLGNALLEMLESRWRSEDLVFATDIADTLLQRFEDKERGGFYFTADDHEQLVHRPKPYSDEATPAGNGIACRLLLRLGYLLGNTDYLDAAARCLRSGWEDMKRIPAAHCSMIDGLREYLDPVTQVVLRGDPGMLQDWRRHSRSSLPRAQIFAIPPDAELPSGLQAKKANGAATAYVCHGVSCTAAIGDLEELVEVLQSGP